MTAMPMVRLQPLVEGSKGGDTKWVHFGSWTIEAPVAPVQRGHMAVPRDLLERFSLTPGQIVGMWTSPDGRHVHLGPVVGVAMGGDSAGLSSEHVRFMTETRRLAREAGVVPVFFHMGNVDLQTGTVRPLHPPDQTVHSAPVPDVLYDRTSYVRPGSRRAARSMRQRLRVMFGTTCVNGFAGVDPWTTYRALRFFPATRSVMVETGPVYSRRQLGRWLERYGQVALYRGRGSRLGRMFYIEAPPRTGGGFRVEGEGVGPFGYETFSNLSRLLGFLRRRGGRGPWFIQRADGRRQLGGRHFFFRMFMQKGAGGNWHGARIHIHWSGPGDDVPEKSRVSSWMDLDEFMFYWLVHEGHDAFLKGAIGRAKKLGPVVAEVLETRFGNQGELGLNFGVDGRGQPLLLGADPRPTLWDGTSHPIQYARFIAERVWRAKYGSVQNEEMLTRGAL